MKEWIIILSLLWSTQIIAKQHNCLPQRLKYTLNNNKYIVYTVKAPTYNGALTKINQQIPTIGFLKKVKIKEKEILINNQYYKKRELFSKINTDIDLFMKYECKWQGEFYITTIIPKKGIHYSNIKYLQDPEFNLKTFKQYCKNKKIFILLFNNDSGISFSSEKAYYSNPTIKNTFYKGYHLLCGKSQIKIRTSKYNYKKYNNNFSNFNVLTIKKTSGKKQIYIEDISFNIWLELTKHI